MLLTSVSQLLEDPFRGLVTLVSFSLALAAAITFHEFSHALVATGLGDPTARRMGRLSLHPAAHLDPIGTVMIFVAGFGWGKPVQVNPAFLRRERAGMAAVALAGPLSNVAVAAVFAAPMKVGVLTSAFVGFSVFRGQPAEVLEFVIASVVFWNLLLAAFNLIPLAPLDGSKVVLGILPRGLASAFAKLEAYGPMILLAVIVIDVVIPGPGILFHTMRPILNLLGLLVLGRQLL